MEDALPEIPPDAPEPESVPEPAPRFRILVADRLGAAGLEQLQQAEDVSYDVNLGLTKDELIAIVGEYDALLIRSDTRIDADVLAAAGRLRVIGRAGMGVDNVDLTEATARGIVVLNTPTANSIATAELTMALLLAVARHVAAAHASLAAGEWRRSDFVGAELFGKTLGIIGFGNVGQLVAARASAFGMEVIAYDPRATEEEARTLDVLLMDLEETLVAADYLTLHAPLTPETREMINEQSISQMKDGAVLINVARGGLVDEAALHSALSSGKLRAAALDVFQSEPPQDSPLVGLPNVLHTPHLGASTSESQREVALQIARQVLDALRGIDYRHAVNFPLASGIRFADIRPYLTLAEKIGQLQRALATSPVRQLSLELRGAGIEQLVRPIAAALLKGLLQENGEEKVNYINAPVLAQERDLRIAQAGGLCLVEYANVIACRVQTDDGQRTVSGALFGGTEPRIVQVDNFKLDAQPKGVVLILQNRDEPGVIGQVGTLLGAYQVNIGEWRMGREAPGSVALSFINLDSEPPESVLQALSRIPAITHLKLISM
jgi:D-3-phosphoglycerate dehydrogenase